MSVAPLWLARVGLVVGVLALFAGDVIAWARMRELHAQLGLVRDCEIERRALLAQQQLEQARLQLELQNLDRQIEEAQRRERERQRRFIGDFPLTRPAL